MYRYTRITGVLLAIAILVLGPSVPERTYLGIKYVLLIAFLSALMLEDYRQRRSFPWTTAIIALSASGVMIALDLGSFVFMRNALLEVSIVLGLMYILDRWKLFHQGKPAR